MYRKLTSFDEVRKASASKELLWTKALIFLNDAITVIGTAQKMKSLYLNQHHKNK